MTDNPRSVPSNLVTRLRQYAETMGGGASHHLNKAAVEAAAEIERLRGDADMLARELAKTSKANQVAQTALSAVRAKLAEYLERLLQGRTLPSRWVGEINDIVGTGLSGDGCTDETKKDGWQPIETAPKDGSPFLGWWSHENKVLHTHWLDNSKTAWPWAGWKAPSLQVSHPNAKPTHWMPLPAPPGSVEETTALPEHVHSWDGDQCHYCHIPRSSVEKVVGHPTLACIYRDGCRKFPACMTEERCCGNDSSIPETR